MRIAASAAAVLLTVAIHGAPTGASPQTEPMQYDIQLVDGLGGTRSAGNSINDRDWIAGYSNLAQNAARHAALWRDGVPTDLGTLGGTHSSVVWPVKNVRGLVAGIAETGIADPLGESWSCSAFFPTATGESCLGFAWEEGVMRALPTLGGNNGFAAGANNRREIAGWAENSVEDPTCVAPQRLQFRAVVWGPGENEVVELPPYPGDSVSAATALNDSGQVVGISGICDVAVGRFSAAHAVLWENGTVTDLGSLGGVSWHTPMAISRRGNVVGFSNPPGDDDGSFLAHAFLWTREEGMVDLGTLPGDETSQALAINEQRQIVGLSCGGAGCRAFLWQDGVMRPLAELAPSFAGVLVYAGDFNEAGEITGRAHDPATNVSKTFLATPRPAHGPGLALAAPRSEVAPGGPTVLPREVREAVARELGLGGAALATVWRE